MFCVLGRAAVALRLGWWEGLTEEVLSFKIWEVTEMQSEHSEDSGLMQSFGLN